MSNPTYIRKPLEFLHGRITTPPFSTAARKEAGQLLTDVQQGVHLGMPISRPMPDIGPNSHELRIQDGGIAWRVFYSVLPEKIVVLDVYQKKTRRTPTRLIANARKRLSEYLNKR